MKKRITALLLVFALLLSLLTGCQKSQTQSPGSDTSASDYASTSPLPLCETLEAMYKLEDYAFQLDVYALDEENVSGDLLYTAKGALYESTKQGHIAFTGTDGGAVTQVYLDGATAYVNSSEFVAFLKAEYEKEQEEIDVSENLNALDDLDLPEYLSIPLTEDIWSTLKGDTTADVRALVRKVFDSIKKDVDKKSEEQGETCSTLVAGNDLQNQVLKALDSLNGDSKIYRGVVEDYLEDNFADFAEACGWTTQEVADLFWDDFADLDTELQELVAQSTWKDWKVQAYSCGDEEQGYTVDLTSVGDFNRRICLSLYPEAAQSVEMPGESESYLDHLEDASYAYLDFLNRREEILSRYETYDEFEDIDPAELEDWSDTDMEDSMIGMELETDAVSGYDRLSSTLAATEDGVEQQVPILKDYSYAECTYLEGDSGSATDIYTTSDGYALEWYSIDATTRNAQQIVEDTTEQYVEIYGTDFEYEILTPQTETILSENGRCAVNAFSYYDSDEGEEVTVLSLAMAIGGSEYALCLEIDLYGSTVMNKEINGVKDLLTYLGLEMPIEVTPGAE